jgi:lysophospholipase L1-like esterase
MGAPPFPSRLIAKRRLIDRILSAAATAKPFTAMASPPTITESAGGANSTVNANTAGNVSIAKNDNRLTYVGTTPVAAGAGFPDNLYYKGAHITKGSGPDANSYSVRFRTDAPAFEFMMKGNMQRYLVFVDGYPVKVGPAPRTKTPASTLLVKVDFGANVLTYGGIDVTAISAGGTGYAIDDEITLAGGTFTTAATVKVRSVNAGAVTGISYVETGVYSVIATTLTQASTTGGGSGFQVQPRWQAFNSTRRLRNIEIALSDNAYFGGLNVGTQDTVLAWPVASSPRIVFFGDSYGSGTMQSRPKGAWCYSAARGLGLDDAWDFAIGSTGYVATNSGAHPNMLQHITDTAALSPDIIVVGMGINDAGLGLATGALQTQVTATYSALFAQHPNALVICLGPWIGAGSTRATLLAVEAEIQAGFLAAAGYDASRHAFIPTISSSWLYPGGATAKAGTTTGVGNTEFWLSSDGVHPHQEGQDYLGSLTAAAVVNQLLAWAA